MEKLNLPVLKINKHKIPSTELIISYAYSDKDSYFE